MRNCISLVVSYDFFYWICSTLLKNEVISNDQTPSRIQKRRFNHNFNVLMLTLRDEMFHFLNLWNSFLCLKHFKLVFRQKLPPGGSSQQALQEPPDAQKKLSGGFECLSPTRIPVGTAGYLRHMILGPTNSKLRPAPGKCCCFILSASMGWANWTVG